MGTVASLLARTGARVEQLNARHHWLRYVLLFGLLFARYGYIHGPIGLAPSVISTYVLALLYFWTIPKEDRQQYNFTVPKLRIIAVAFAVGVICYAWSLTTAFFFEDDLIKMQEPISIAMGLPFSFVFLYLLFGLPEEILFRGILWGEGRRLNLSNFSNLCIQTILFFAAHRFYDNFSALYLQMLVFGLILGIVAWKTKSVLASAIVLALISCTGDSFVHALTN
jgi:membrane protease YdiL (CAAX protease family)